MTAEPSITDQAAGAAFDAIDAKITELGYDPNRVWAVTMVMMQGVGSANATVAGNFPGEVTPQSLLAYAVHQLELLAAECGQRLVVMPTTN